MDLGLRATDEVGRSVLRDGLTHCFGLFMELADNWNNMEQHQLMPTNMFPGLNINKNGTTRPVLYKIC